MIRKLRESQVEAYLVLRVRQCGGDAFKFTSPGRRGVPDRIILLPGGVMCFAEVKAPGRRPTILQGREHDKLRKLGFPVAVVDSREAVDKLLEAQA